MAALGTAITLLAVPVLGVALLFRLERALPAVLAALLLLPVAAVGGTSFRAEHALMPVVLLAVVMRLGADRGSRAGGVPLLLAAAWVSLGLATAIESPVTTGSWLLGAYTVMRPLGWLALGLLAWPPAIVPRLVRAWLLSAGAASLLAMAQAAQIPVARQITDLWYASAGRAAGSLIAEAELQGFFARPLGPFENVSYAATAELLALASALWWLTSGPDTRTDRWLATSVLLVSVAAGLATVSATFLAGAPLVVAVTLALGARRMPVGQLVAAGIAATCVAMLLVWALDAVWGGGASFAAQVDRVRTVSLFANRYSSGEGVMADAIRAIGVRPVFGWGLLAGGDVFFSDSLYVFVAYTTGLVGSVLIGMLLFVPWAAARRTAPDAARFVLLWALVLLMAGLGAPSIFVPRVMEWWWGLAGLMIGLGRSRTVGVEPETGRPLPFRMPFTTDLRPSAA